MLNAEQKASSWRAVFPVQRVICVRNIATTAATWTASAPRSEYPGLRLASVCNCFDRIRHEMLF